MIDEPSASEESKSTLYPPDTVLPSRIVLQKPECRLGPFHGTIADRSWCHHVCSACRGDRGSTESKIMQPQVLAMGAHMTHQILAHVFVSPSHSGGTLHCSTNPSRIICVLYLDKVDLYNQEVRQPFTIHTIALRSLCSVGTEYQATRKSWRNEGPSVGQWRILGPLLHPTIYLGWHRVAPCKVLTPLHHCNKTHLHVPTSQDYVGVSHYTPK